MTPSRAAPGEAGEDVVRARAYLDAADVGYLRARLAGDVADEHVAAEELHAHAYGHALVEVSRVVDDLDAGQGRELIPAGLDIHRQADLEVVVRHGAEELERGLLADFREALGRGEGGIKPVVADAEPVARDADLGRGAGLAGDLYLPSEIVLASKPSQ